MFTFRTAILFVIIATLAGIWFYFSKNNAQSTVRIPLILFANHPALNATAAGVKAIVQPHVHIDEYNAQGDIAIALQIAKQCAAEEPVVMIGIATPATQAVNKARDREKTLLAFAAVSDPHGAHLDTEPLVVGVADTPPIEQLIETMVKLFPQVTNVGVVYSPSEINSTYAVKQLEKILAQTKLKLSIKGVNNTGMVKVAAQELIDGGVEIIYVPLDNFMVSSLPILSLVASEQNIPLIANDPALIAQGITLAVGPDFEESGKQLGELILAYLKGSEIAEPIQLSRIHRTVINSALAQRWSLDTSVITAELV